MKKLVLLLGVFVFVSCYTDNNDFETDAIDIQLLKSVSLNGSLLYDFEYYPDRRIMSQTSFSGQAISHFVLFEYTNDTVYKTTSGIFSSKTKSYKANSNTLKLMQYDNQDNLLYFYLNKYSSSNCGLKQIETYTQYGQLYTITEYDYTDSNCSYNSRRELFNGTPKNNYAIIKDDKQNYLASLNAWPAFEKKHNIIEYKQWDENANLLIGNSYSSTFEYDANGYPIQEIRTMLSGGIKIYTYEYY